MECCTDLRKNCHISYDNMKGLMMWYDLSKEQPEHFELCVTTQEDLYTDISESGYVEHKNESPSLFIDDLVSFDLKPDGLKGESLFNHMTTY